jgi:hypothetical protein
MAKVKVSREGIGAGKKFKRVRRTKSVPTRPNGYQSRKRSGT